jgi:hypothetical protein
MKNISSVTVSCNACHREYALDQDYIAKNVRTKINWVTDTVSHTIECNCQVGKLHFERNDDGTFAALPAADCAIENESFEGDFFQAIADLQLA